MSLLNTLAKVAIGVAVAKGVSTLARGSQSGRIGQGTGGTLRGESGSTGGGAMGGLEDMMGSILGTGSGTSTGSTQAGSPRTSGSLGDLLNELGGMGGAASGGATSGGGIQSTRTGQPDLGSILGQLAGQLGGSGRGSAGAGSMGGLGDLLGQLGGAGAAGGIGGLLGGLLGGGSAAQAGTPGAAGGGLGGLGGLLDQALRNGGTTQVAAAPEHELAAGILLKAMIQAAKSDGQIDAAEQSKLMDKIGDASAEEQAFIAAELKAPVDPEGLAQSVPAGMEAQAYMLSVMAIDLDNQAEAQYLDRFARALGLQAADVNAIHAKVGAPALYA